MSKIISVKGGSASSRKKKTAKKVAVKKIIKKAVVKKTTKKVTAKKKVIRKTKKTKPTEEIIFDSKIGKTEALFVSLPDQEASEAKPEDLEINPEIDKAIEEFDIVQGNTKRNENMSEIKEQVTEEQETGEQEIKKESKSFWQSLMFWKK